MDHKRRKFLERISALMLSLPFLSFKQLTGPKFSSNTVYFDESGTLPGDGTFVIGSLKCADIAHCLKEIKALRKKHNYQCELKYRSRDKYKLAYALDIIDFFFAEPSLSFQARLLEGNPDASRADFFEYIDFVTQSNYQKLLDDMDLAELDLVNFHKAHLIDEQKSLIEEPLFKTRYSETKDDLGQLTDLLTGNIYGRSAALENVTKKAVLNHLNQKLEDQRLQETSGASTKFTLTKVQIR